MKSNKEWELHGKADPLWAVASWKGREKHGKNPWTDAEFYALGASDWRDFLPHWRHFGLNPAHCIEVGCGAGRMTKQLAETFQHLTALDVSVDQIAKARQHISDTHVSFYKTDGTHVPPNIAPVTAVFSVHVFQHFNDFSDTEAVLTELAHAIERGGTMMIHLPVHVLPQIRFRGLLRLIISAYHHFSLFRAFIHRWQGKLLMRGLRYEQDWIVFRLTKLGFDEIEFRSIRTKSNGDWHSFVLAKKG